jgi:formate-dependent nitrite reductase membrane component NrfD
VSRCRWIGTAGSAIGTVLLVADLGRPERFLNMLRVFRPSSPMSVGSWVLAGSIPTSAGSAVLAGSGGALRSVGNVSGLFAGVLGLPLTGYTAVLLSNTAVPLWQGTRPSLPVLFTASGMASAASLLELMDLSEQEARIVHRFGLAGRVADLAASLAVEREADRVEQVGKPLHEGVAATLWNLAKGLTAASLVVSLVPTRRRWRRTLSGLLGTAGAVALRFAVFQAGRRSAVDPRATFRQQRAGHGAVEATGTAAVTGTGGRRAVS